LYGSITGQKEVRIRGKKYTVDINNGVIAAATIPHLLTIEEFWDRFTDAEEEGMDDSGQKEIQKLIKMCDKRRKLNIKSGWVVAGMDKALQTNVVDQAAYDRILAIS
jgi:hypothetical protein